MSITQGASFRTAILKLTAFCNLNCDYCYMFNLRDQSFIGMPNQMPVDVALALADRLGTYTSALGVPAFDVVLHGGEPTLWPESSFDRFLTRLRQVEANGSCQFDVALQTNAYRPLPQTLLRLFRKHRVSLGVSVDGPADRHDRHRRTHDDRGSYARVMANVQQILKDGYGDIVRGFLTVIDPGQDPGDYLEWVARLPLPKVDVLWPMQFTWDFPPWESNDIFAYAEEAPYGRWLASLFDLWLKRDDPRIVIRHFTDVVSFYLGAKTHTDTIVNDSVSMFVVEPTGGFSLPDYLRVGGDGVARTPYLVQSDTIESLHAIDDFRTLFDLSVLMPRECSSCAFRDVCGGGFIPGRARRAGGPILDPRPSVLCPDQYHFFRSALHRLTEADFPEKPPWIGPKVEKCQTSTES